MNDNLISSSRVIRVKKNNFIGFGWEIDQVNTTPNGSIVTHTSNYVKLECAQRNADEPGLNRGAVLLSLPTSIDSSLRRVRLRNNLHNGIRLADLTSLHYNSFIEQNINNSAPDLALQLDITNDQTRELNIFFTQPIQHSQNSTYPNVMKNVWQRWDALNGYWQVLDGSFRGLPPIFTLQTLLSLPQFSNARIINTTGGSNEGGGIRFTVGGTQDYNDFKGYVDAFVIGTSQDSKPVLYDFVCDGSPND